MDKCYNDGDFRKYFDENMKALGAPTPNSLFTTYTTAIADAGLITQAIAKLGARATLAEIAGATLATEKLMVLGAIGASAYAGLVIGSIAVASGRSLGCGARISDAFVLINRNNLQFPDWQTFYHRYPQIIDTSRPLRRNVGLALLQPQARAA